MDLFGKKRIAELEEKLQKEIEQKENVIKAYNRSLEGMERLEQEYNGLKAGCEGLKAIMEDKNRKAKELEHDLYQSERTIKELNRQLEKYKSIMLSVDMEKINHFRYLRGKLSNASLKRSRNKLIRLLAEDMEKIFKEITE